MSSTIEARSQVAMIEQSRAPASQVPAGIPSKRGE